MHFISLVKDITKFFQPKSYVKNIFPGHPTRTYYQLNAGSFLIGRFHTIRVGIPSCSYNLFDQAHNLLVIGKFKINSLLSPKFIFWDLPLIILSCGYLWKMKVITIKRLKSCGYLRYSKDKLKKKSRAFGKSWIKIYTENKQV